MAAWASAAAAASALAVPSPSSVSSPSAVAVVAPSSPAQFPIGLTNATGDTSVVLLIPPSPYLTGFPIFHQYFYLDNTAPNGASIGTTGLMTRVGKL